MVLVQQNKTITRGVGYQGCFVDGAEVLQKALGVVDGRVQARAGLQPSAIQIFCHQWTAMTEAEHLFLVFTWFQHSNHKINMFWLQNGFCVLQQSPLLFCSFFPPSLSTTKISVSLCLSVTHTHTSFFYIYNKPHHNLTHTPFSFFSIIQNNIPSKNKQNKKLRHYPQNTFSVL